MKRFARNFNPPPSPFWAGWSLSRFWGSQPASTAKSDISDRPRFRHASGPGEKVLDPENGTTPGRPSGKRES